MEACLSGLTSTNTLNAYEHVLALFALEHADLSLADLEPPDGAATVRAFLDRHWRNSAATTRRQSGDHAVVVALAGGGGPVEREPATNIRAPKEKRVERRSLSRGELERLIGAQESLRDQAAIMLLGWCGLRKSELGALRIRDFDLAAGIVLVHGKGGHVDALPLGFKRLTETLYLHFQSGQLHPDEVFLHPRTQRTRPMDTRRCIGGSSAVWHAPACPPT
jgi:integrase/recombinase XerC